MCVCVCGCAGGYDGVQCGMTCSAGYVPTGGDFLRTCAANGTWTGSDLVCTLAPPVFLDQTLSVLEVRLPFPWLWDCGVLA